MITIVGIGPGKREYMTEQAASAVRNARVLLGGSRVLKAIGADSGGRLVELPVDCMADAVVGILQSEARYGDVTLAVSGDPGFYSLARRVVANFGRDGVTLIPGVSCVQLMAARLSKSWAGVSSATLHGRERPDIRSLASKLLASPAFVLLLGEPEKVAEDIGWLCSDECIKSAKAALGWDLGLPGERITEADTLGGIDAEARGGRLALLWLEKKRALPTSFEAEPLGMRGVIPDEWFEREGGVPMTKAFTRAVAISLLSPLDGARILEVGSGTGAMTVELARAAGECGRVACVESSLTALELTRRNVTRAGVAERVGIIEGRVPQTMPGGRYDAAFVGGHGERIEDVLSAVWERLESGGRMLLTSITPQTTSKALEFIGDTTPAAGVWRAHSSRGRRAGNDWLMLGNNPVDLIWGDK
ncbi:MAG: precorrin-6y C5,15-methyltransferase (decarboxylating) subunit CbiE [Synergistaceae bacterium]|jgi:precorrin-6Y C5,15-methyltransferase (decarboxylating)|nr:precorrin-6y C5,15-methyltransferase (decarboxylating) subunit CbiE [Synergistaceae bacterium]